MRHTKSCRFIHTKHFVTVDGDTIVDPAFMQVELDLDKLGVDDDYHGLVGAEK